mmetsp:Transcript_17878/g.46682  ORF Transcript_17878/g.46682 Transcript_17878/m.46682 type:complete len:296 (-) Transcript_17878:173-1060(-)
MPRQPADSLHMAPHTAPRSGRDGHPKEPGPSNRRVCYHIAIARDGRADHVLTVASTQLEQQLGRLADREHPSRGAVASRGRSHRLHRRRRRRGRLRAPQPPQLERCRVAVQHEPALGEREHRAVWEWRQLPVGRPGAAKHRGGVHDERGVDPPCHQQPVWGEHTRPNIVRVVPCPPGHHPRVGRLRLHPLDLDDLVVHPGRINSLPVIRHRKPEDVCFVLPKGLQQCAVLAVPELRPAVRVPGDQRAVRQHLDGPHQSASLPAVALHRHPELAPPVRRVPQPCRAVRSARHQCAV